MNMTGFKKIMPALVLTGLALYGCCCGPRPVSVAGPVENAVAKDYLETVSYPDGDYSATEMPRFMSMETDFRKDQPSPLVVRWNNKGSLEGLKLQVASDRKMHSPVIVTDLESVTDSAFVYNLVPGQEYWFKVTGTKGKKQKTLARGKLVPEGTLRMIRTDALHNVRDLGGWKTADGQTLKYGLIYRGGQMNRQDPPTEEDKALMKDFLGIKADVDLRWDSELDGGTPDDPSDDLYFTPLGDGVEYAHMPVNLYALWDADTTQWNNMLSFMMDHVIAGEPCYVHCAAGADRTGTTCFLLEGLLGVPEQSLAKEYELTSFSTYGERLRNGPNGYGPMVNYILGRKGDTLRDKFEDFFTEYVGIPKDKIEAFRAAMLEQ